MSAASKPKDRRPAFPFSGQGVPGMTLRQYYASQALLGFCTSFSKIDPGYTPEHYAVADFAMADAMIVEGEK